MVATRTHSAEHLECLRSQTVAQRFRTVYWDRTRTHTIYLEKLVLMRKQLRRVVRSSCQNADVEKQGEGRQQRGFSACLVALYRKVGIVYMTKFGRKSGMPLFSWWSEDVTAETLMFWRLKSQGPGVRKTSAQVVPLRPLFSVFRKCSGAFRTAAKTNFLKTRHV